MSALETLKKIQYVDLVQFQEDINKNFAIIENSPLYKGIPGNQGLPGTAGLRGSRGTKFLFVNPNSFYSIFPGELQNQSQIDINYINNKLVTFQNKQKLLQTFNVTEFVDKDIIVLTNTLMIQYNLTEEKFVSTGISFNESSNLLSTIQQQIQDYIIQQLASNQTINNLRNIFESYNTLGKNYADTNNTFVTTNLLDSSIYSPHIPGYNSNIGIAIDNHKYFGFSDTMFPNNNNGTIVFGNMKKYFNLLMNTISTDSNQTLTSDYSPGINNIPTAVFLQDTENNGILFGMKGNQNLKRFGSIFKNEQHEIVIKSDSGKLESEYSELIIHKDYLKFDKLGLFGNSLEVSRDLSVFGDVNNKYFKSGKFTTGASSTNNFNIGVSEFGRQKTTDYVTISKHVAEYEKFNNYISKVFVTTNDGTLSKDYQLETATLDTNELNNPNYLSQLTSTINNPHNILTSNYFGLLLNRINNISQFLIDNVWFKNQWNTNVIPSLKLNDSLEVVNNVNFSGNLIVDKTLNPNKPVLKLGGYRQEIITSKINYQYFKDKVLITDINGDLSDKYELEKTVLNPLDLLPENLLTIFSESDLKILSTKYYAHLAKKINSVNSNLIGNYWTKQDFISGIIPSLILNTGLQVRGGTTFIDSIGNIVFNINPTTGELTLGNTSGNNVITFDSDLIKFTQFSNNVLYVDGQGNLRNDYFMELNSFNNNELSGNNTITNNIAPGGNLKTIARGYHIRWIVDKLNNLIIYLNNNVWYKNQYNTGEIPELVVSSRLKSKGNFLSGDSNNPDFFGDNQGLVSVGKINGITRINGAIVNFSEKLNTVFVSDNKGNIINHELETNIPTSSNMVSNGTLGNGLNSNETDIESDYYDKTKIQNFLTFPTLANKHITSNYFNWIVNHFKVIRKLLYDRPTYAEVGLAVPLGSIIYWNNAFGPIPTGWVICDGRWIPGISKRTPNILDRYVKGSTIPNTIGGNNNHSVSLIADNNGPHIHYVNPHTHGFPLPFDSMGGGVGDMQSLTGTINDDEQWSSAANTFDGGGGYTNQSGTGKPFNIEPQNITLIPIMKFWNGIGNIPVVTLPAWSTITGIQNNLINSSVILKINILDNTVKDFEIIGSNDSGVNWNSLKVYNNFTGIGNNIQLPGNINLPSNGDWKFKCRALSGDSFGTSGELSNECNHYVYTYWAYISQSNLTEVQGGPNTITFNVTINEPTTTTGDIMISLDSGINWNLLYQFNTNQIVGNKLTVPLVVNGNNLSNEKNVAYKFVATNGTPVNNLHYGDETSNILLNHTIEFPKVMNFAIINDAFVVPIKSGHSPDVTKCSLNITSSLNDSTVTQVSIEYMSTINVWTTIVTTTPYSNNINILLTDYFTSDENDNHYPVTKAFIRLKALNGLSVGMYSTKFFTYESF